MSTERAGRTPPLPGAQAGAAGRIRAPVLALLVFLVGATVSLLAAVWAARSEKAMARAAFERSALRIDAEIKRRFEMPLQGLRGAAGALAALQSGDRPVLQAQWHDYVQASRLLKDVPGIRGLAYVERVDPLAPGHGAAGPDADAAADLSMHLPDPARQDERYRLRFAEPTASNGPILGLDGSGGTRLREALQGAVDAGQPTLSAPISLLLDGRRVGGFLVLLPLYGRPDEAPDLSRQGRPARGLLLATLATDELLDGAADAAQGQLGFELSAGPDAGRAGPLIYPAQVASEAPLAPLTDSATIDITRPLQLIGRTFALRLRSTAAFESSFGHTVSVQVLLVDLLLSALLAWLVYLTVMARRRAERLATDTHEDHERLAMLARRTSNAVVITDLQRRITWVNAGFERLTGYTLDDVRGRSPGTLLQHPDTDPATVARLRAALDAREPCRCELLNVSKDGRLYWIDAEIQTMVDDHGELRGFMAIEIDITDKREAQRALQSSQALLDHTGRIGGVGGWQLDLLAGDLRWTDQTCTIHDLPVGYQPTLEEVVSFCVPASRPQFSQAVQDAIHFGQGFDLELQCTTASGRPIWVRAVGEVKSAQSLPVCLIGTFQDITARRALEAQLRQHSEEMSSILHNLPCGLSVFDADLRLVASNQQYRRLLDFPDHLFDLPSPSFERFIRFNAERGEYGDGDVDDQVRQVIERARGLTAPHHFDRMRPDGTALDVRGAPMPGGGFVTTYTDVSAMHAVQRQLELRTAQAEQASVAKGQFLANMSHEIRTPMNAILGMLALLRRTPLNLRQADYAQKAEGATRALLSLINDILDFSKIDAQKMVLDPVPFRVEQLVNELSVMLSTNAGGKPLDLLFDLDPALPPALRGDFMRLQQVLVNLGSNAVKFTAEGEVVIALQVLERRDESVRLEISVRDTGIGISPDNQLRIFSGFTQAEASTTRRFGGTGLGLAISQRLVALMGGELRVDSRLGQGTRFHFCIELPVCASTECGPGEAVDVPAAALQHVLLVDDNGTAREMLRRAARTLGWQAQVAASGAEAIELFRQAAQAGRPFDAVFMDWRMPDMDGWETLRRIRDAHAGGQTPLLLMLTGNGRDALEQRSDEEQAMIAGYLVKPVTAAMLATSVREALGRGGVVALEPPVSPRRLAGLRILLTEDNVNNQQVARELLEDEGARIQIAQHGQEAVAAIEQAADAFDLILMDLQMPVMDGLMATRMIRGQLKQERLPIVAMTANATAADREACLQAGMNDHVGKPFDLNQLVSVIIRCTGRTPQQPAPARLNQTANRALEQAAQVAGVDLAPALDRMGGRVDVYLRMLRNFANELTALPEGLRQMARQGDWPVLVRACHTVRGSAATLGILELAQCAGRAEAMLAEASKGRTVAPQLEPEIDAVLRSAESTARKLSALLAAVTPARAPQAGADAPDWPALQGELQRLSRLLDQSDMAALEVVESIEQRFAAALGARLAELVQAASALDFEQAGRHCQTLLEHTAGMMAAPSRSS